MPANYTYLLIDIGALLVPFIFSFHKKIQFHKEWKYLWPAIVITALLFIAWDICYTSIGVWGFNEHYLTGLKIYNLPIEEVLFFICIPYSSIFTYYCFEKFKLSWAWLANKSVPVILSVILIPIGLYMYDKLYTSATFIALGSITIYMGLVKKPYWLSNFYLMFIVILLPFFIVNGLLTGTGLDEPVVWYNNNENMHIRLLTIPVEDVFYGMLLLLLNTLFFELFRKKHAA